MHYEPKILVTQKIIITNPRGEMLILRRSSTDPTMPLSWDIPGGVVEVGENLEEGILREVKEEAGIDVKDLKLLTVFDSASKLHPYLICIGYTAKTTTDIITLSYEHDAYEWVTKKEFLSRNAKQHIKELVEKY